jgi:hypothetical protein
MITIIDIGGEERPGIPDDHQALRPISSRRVSCERAAKVAAGQPISSRVAANAVTAAWRSSRVCAADICVRIRALPTGTTG